MVEGHRLRPNIENFSIEKAGQKLERNMKKKVGIPCLEVKTPHLAARFELQELKCELKKWLSG